MHGNLAQIFVDSVTIRVSLQIQVRMAIETFGVGTRMALPVSLPARNGNALAAAVAHPFR